MTFNAKTNEEYPDHYQASSAYQVYPTGWMDLILALQI